MVAGAHPIHPPAAGSMPGAAAAAGGAAAGGGAALGLPQGRQEVEQTLQVSRNIAELLQEMLAPIQAPGGDKSALQETFVTDLADQCHR